MQPDQQTDDASGLSPHVREIYETRFAGAEAERQRLWRLLARHFFQQWIDPDSTVLDLGAGYCEFINNIQARARWALDLNPDTALKAAPGVRVLAQPVSERWAIADGSLDCVFSSNFFEHLPTRREIGRAHV